MVVQESGGWKGHSYVALLQNIYPWTSLICILRLLGSQRVLGAEAVAFGAEINDADTRVAWMTSEPVGATNLPEPAAGARTWHLPRAPGEPWWRGWCRALWGFILGGE